VARAIYRPQPRRAAGMARENPVTKVIGPGTTQASSTLYERIGGEPKLVSIVTGVYDGMKADKEIGKFFARFRLEKLTERTIDYLRGEWGGDPYKGSDLWIAHSHLGVTSHYYDIMMKLYAKMLKKEKIPKKETEECMASLEKMRAPCVDRDLKFKNLYLKHTEKLAAAAGGDGWGRPAVTQEERQAKEKATQENIRAEELKQAEAKKAAGMTAAVSAPAAPKAKAKAKAKARAMQAAASEAVAEAQLDSPRSGECSTRGSSGEVEPPKTAPKAAARMRSVLNKAGERSKALAFAFSPAADQPPEDLPPTLLAGALLMRGHGAHLPVSL